MTSYFYLGGWERGTTPAATVEQKMKAAAVDLCGRRHPI